MINQNVVVSDEKSGIDITIKVSLAKKTLFSSPESVLQAGSGRYVAIKKLKKLEAPEGGAKVSSWLDSMRAASPTRTTNALKLSTATSLLSRHHTDDNSSWTFDHPSALGMFEQIARDSKGKQIVMFLDYDGTLSPIVEDPDRAFMTTEMRVAVRDVARHFPTAIVTGRCRDKVYSFVGLDGLYYAGSHGMDIKGPSRSRKYKKGHKPLLFQPANEFLPMIDQVYKALIERTKSVSGARVENNKFCVSVHFRCVEENMWNTLAEQVRVVLNNYPELKLSQGRKVLEIRPTIKWDKGKALEFLLESLGYANSRNVFPIYIGDDRTDEDAFKVLRERGQGLGILVSKNPKETNASYSLQDPGEVKDFLRRLVDWKRNVCSRTKLKSVKLESTEAFF